MPNLHRLKWYGALALGAAFVLAGLFIAVTRDAGGWLVVAFFGLVVAMAVHELWPELIEGKFTPPETILNRFPGPVSLMTPRRKQIFILLATVVFGGCALWMALNWDFSGLERFFMWLGALACAVAVPFLLLPIVRGSALRLDREGFEVFQGLRRSRFRWNENGEFSVADVGAPIVIFNNTTIGHGTVAGINQTIVGYSGALPATYGMDAWSLASLLNEWRTRALAIRPPASRSGQAP
ncbi:MAG: hypothetical protein ACOY5F_17410 [Pseudomonadota bacterium]